MEDHPVKIHPFGSDNITVFADGHVERHPATDYVMGCIVYETGAGTPPWGAIAELERLLEL